MAELTGAVSYLNQVNPTAVEGWRLTQAVQRVTKRQDNGAILPTWSRFDQLSSLRVMLYAAFSDDISSLTASIGH